MFAGSHWLPLRPIDVLGSAGQPVPGSGGLRLRRRQLVMFDDADGDLLELFGPAKT